MSNKKFNIINEIYDEIIDKYPHLQDINHIYDNIFGGSDVYRILIPYEEEDQTYKQLVNDIQKIAGFVSFDPKTNELIRKIVLKTPDGEKTKNQSMKIGTAINKLKIDPELKKQYLAWLSNRRTTVGTERHNKYSIIISRHPIDIIRMSDFDGISSCHSPDSNYFKCAIQESKTGGCIALLVKTSSLSKLDDGMIESSAEIFIDGDRGVDGINPLARLRILRYDIKRNDKDKNGVGTVLVPSIKIYSSYRVQQNIPSGFIDVVTRFFNTKQKEFFSDKNEVISLFNNKKIVRRGGSYQDGSSPSSVMFKNILGINNTEEGIFKQSYTEYSSEDTDDESNTSTSNILDDINEQINDFGLTDVVSVENIGDGYITINATISTDIDFGGESQNGVTDNIKNCFIMLDELIEDSTENTYISRLEQLQSKIESNKDKINNGYDMSDIANFSSFIKKIISMDKLVADLFGDLTAIDKLDSELRNIITIQFHYTLNIDAQRDLIETTDLSEGEKERILSDVGSFLDRIDKMNENMNVEYSFKDKTKELLLIDINNIKSNYMKYLLDDLEFNNFNIGYDNSTYDKDKKILFTAELSVRGHSVNTPHQDNEREIEKFLNKVKILDNNLAELLMSLYVMRELTTFESYVENGDDDKIIRDVISDFLKIDIRFDYMVSSFHFYIKIEKKLSYLDINEIDMIFDFIFFLDRNWDGLVKQSVISEMYSIFKPDNKIGKLSIFKNKKPQHTIKGHDMVYRNNRGRLHREDGPAVEWASGTKEWLVNGQRHREDGPAIEYANGDKEWWVKGQRHREDGPAIEWADGRKEWWINGKRHREDGPAVEYADGTIGWYINGVNLTQEEFNQWVIEHKST